MTNDRLATDERRPPSQRVVEAVAAEQETSAIGFEPPLYEVIDPEALDSLVRAGTEDLRIQFRYQDVSVVVTGSGRVDISSVSTEGHRSSECAISDE